MRKQFIDYGRIFLVFILVLGTIIMLTSCNGDVYSYARFYYDGYLNTSSYIIVEYNQKDTSYKSIEKDIYSDIENTLKWIENTFSKTLSNSSTYLVNNNSGVTPIHVTKEFIDLIKFSNEISSLYPQFDLTIGPLTTLWNVNSLTEYCLVNDELCKIPSKEEIESTKEYVSFKDIVIDEINNNVYLKQSGMKLDFGAIAKGYALELITQYMLSKKYSFFTINLGGSVYVHGNSIKKAGPIPIDILDESDQIILHTWMNDSYALTSSAYFRKFTVNGLDYHHIIDATTGYPSNSNISFVSIYANDGKLADVLSTLVYILGVDEGINAIKHYQKDYVINFVIASIDNNLYISNDVNYELVNKNYKINII